MKNSLLFFIPIVLLACNNQTASKKENGIIDSLKIGTTSAIKDSSGVSFQKELTLQGITYHIISKGKGSIQILTITPVGLTLINDAITVETDPVVGAEIEDLDKDGFPELLVYTQSAGTGSYGNVMGYSPNKGKSLSMIYMPPLDPKSSAAKGYMGHDEFAIVESNLLRRFKIFEGDSTINKSTGKIRQIQYQLKNGEASKKFVMGKIIEIAVP